MTDVSIEYKQIQKKKHSYSFTVFPDNLNYAGTLFGGKLLSEMDLAASNAARKLLYDTDCNGLVTAHISEVDFLSSAYLGDIVEFESEISHLGRSSIKVRIEVGTEDINGIEKRICTAQFVFVALKDGQPYPHYKTF